MVYDATGRKLTRLEALAQLDQEAARTYPIELLDQDGKRVTTCSVTIPPNIPQPVAVRLMGPGEV